MVMLISNSICISSEEVRGVQRGGWGVEGGAGGSGFVRDLSLLFIGFQSLSAHGQYFIEPVLFTSLWDLYYLLP